MSINLDDILQKVYQYRKPIAFGFVLLGIWLTDLTIGSVILFWFIPLSLGVIAGILIGSVRAGIFALLGAMIGRFLSILFMFLTRPGFLETLDLFISAIGSFIGIFLPGGSLIVIVLSILISSIFAALGGTAGGSTVQLVQSYTSNTETNTN